jgi:hypothetical protein
MPQGKANRTRRSYNDLFVMGTWAASITAFTVFHEQKPRLLPQRGSCETSNQFRDLASLFVKPRADSEG